MDVYFGFSANRLSGVTSVKLAGDFNSWSGEEMTAPTPGSIYWTLTKSLADEGFTCNYVVTFANGDIWEFPGGEPSDRAHALLLQSSRRPDLSGQLKGYSPCY